MANFIETENAKVGTSEWRLTNPGQATGVIEGYASLTSVNRGQTISFFVSSKEPYTLDIFRLGYYGGQGGRRMMATVSRTATQQVMPSVDTTTGLAEANWVNPYNLSIPISSDPTNWMSGFYVVKLTATTSGKQNYIVFTVRDDARVSDFILVQSVNTYQAYNVWGGKSLYGTLSNLSDTDNAAVKVSFNRPYYGSDNNGAGDLFWWEYPMASWMESLGYDVSYATDVDVDGNSNLLLNHKAFLFVGHGEYWSWKMRDNAENAIKAGVSAGFFAGNSAFCQVRYEPSTINGVASRNMVGYKTHWPQDPITPANLKTNEFRLAPVSRSEDSMMGVRFNIQARMPWCVEDASHWAFTGTGLKNGDCIVNPDGSPFIGYEVDGVGPFSPANVQVLAHSPINSKGEYFGDTTTYRAPSGATVFASGSIAWSQSIPAIVQLTKNVFTQFLTKTFPDTTPIRTPLPTPFVAVNIGDGGRAGYVTNVSVTASGTSMTLKGSGQDRYRTSDALYYVYQSLTGDGQITARMNGLDLFWDRRAGLMVRNTLDGGSTYVALASRPSGSVHTTSSLSEGAEMFARTQIGNNSSALMGSVEFPVPNWLRLVRVGNVFTSYYSTNGTSWTQLASTTLAMNSTVSVGLFTMCAEYNNWCTASFDNVNVSIGNTPPDDPPLTRSNWTVSATESNPGEPPSNAIDNNLNTRWSSGVSMHPGQQFTVGLPVDTPISRIRFEVGSSTQDFPRGCTITIKNSGGTTVATPACTVDVNGVVDVKFPKVTGNSVVITQIGTSTWWWSIAELNIYGVDQATDPPLNRSNWTVSATESNPGEPPSNAIDNNLNTRWSSGVSMHPGQQFTVGLPVDTPISRIRFEVGSSTQDFPRGCTITIKNSGGTTVATPACTVDANGTVDVSFPKVTGNSVVITQTGTSTWWWSIADLSMY